MRKKITQEQMVFYKLYSAFREDAERFVPAWEFGGEMFIKELGKWVLMSYKCPTRLTDLFQENPTLLERKEVMGKSGSTYFAYRFRPGVSRADIQDESIRELYDRVKFNEEKPVAPKLQTT